ncbi:transglycosylase SLT domain-containing protein [Candidatus Methylomirabilis sp.]|uniref:transglycosylase SLT domain-containing protein n=1 Tax=Candidatus Methylomirabilis sp. TaxID=2032687 RepID=UPI0030767452
MTKIVLCALFIASLLVVLPAVPAETKSADQADTATGAPRRLSIDIRPWTGDFEAMLKGRMIRVLIPYSRTLYFNDKGHERGVAAELARDFERYLNQKHKTQLKKRPITIYLVHTTRDKLLPNLVAGLGDIAIGNLTETEERLKVADFVAPKDRKPMFEVVVTGPKSPSLETVDDLAGKTVHVRKSSSYYGSLTNLNARLKKEGKVPIKLVLVPDSLEDEDMMEMLNAGLLECIVVDDWKAKMWAQILPKIKVRTDLAASDGGYAGWAIRKNSPQLSAAINDFYKNYVKKQAVVDYRLSKYMKRIKQIKDNTEAAEWTRFEQTIDLFEKYGKQYDFDPLLLAAQGYQESQLNQNAKSAVGAIGIMQIMPTTGKELRVGDIRRPEPNVHGGAKYMDKLMTQYFKDATFTEGNRALFAFASYNAGPGNVAKMREEAEKRGFDPNKWFNNVELVIAEKVGMEPTTYVRNIYKYYVSYTLQQEAYAAHRAARDQMVKSAK